MPDDITAKTPIRQRRSTRSWQAIRWWGEGIGIVGVCLLIALANLAVSGLTVALIAPVGWGTVYALLKLDTRREYRRGFRHGYESATRAVLQRLRGQTPDMEIRATVYGDPTPEPWHVHTPIDPTHFRHPWLTARDPGRQAPQRDRLRQAAIGWRLASNLGSKTGSLRSRGPRSTS